jgi:hypothetical protein
MTSISGWGKADKRDADNMIFAYVDGTPPFWYVLCTALC